MPRSMTDPSGLLTNDTSLQLTICLAAYITYIYNSVLGVRSEVSGHMPRQSQPYYLYHFGVDPCLPVSNRNAIPKCHGLAA